MYIISTTLGPIYPAVDGRSKEFVCTENTWGWPSTDPGAEVVSISCGSDTYTVYQRTFYGDKNIHLYKNGEHYSSSPISNTSYAGTAVVAEAVGDTQVRIFYVALPGTTWNYAYWEEYIRDHVIQGGATAYAAYTIGTFNLADIQVEARDWDEGPEADGDTTDDNFGGAFADLMEFEQTDLQDYLSDLGWGTQSGLDPYNVDEQGNAYCGFFTPYVLSHAQLVDLGRCMFSTDMWNTIKQWFEGPANVLQGILRCLDFPCYLPTGGATTICVCGQEIFFSGGSGTNYATGHHLTSRYKDVNCGTIRLLEVWGTARDYTDTNVSIYLPFVGTKELDPQIVVGHNISLALRIDCWTGDIIYILHVDNDAINGKWYRDAGYVYRWTGNCASEIPIGRADGSRGLIPTLAGLGGIAAVAGGFGAVGVPMLGVAAAGVASGKLQKRVETSGSLTGNNGVLDVLYPYIMVQRSVPNYPADWRAQIGAPKKGTYTGDDLEGYTLFESIFLVEVEGASGEEIDELTRQLCSEGCIL